MYEEYAAEYMMRDISVIRSTNHLNLKVHGYVVDETKNVFVIMTKNGRKMIPKKGSVFRINLDGRYFDIYGDVISVRPEDRVKYLRRIIKRLKGEYNGKHRN